MHTEINTDRKAHIEMESLITEIETSLGELAEDLITETHFEGDGQKAVVYLVLCNRPRRLAVELEIPQSKISSHATMNQVEAALYEIDMHPSGHSGSNLPDTAADVSVAYVDALIERHPLAA